jgi:predicted AlkP superfamily phosphohydrolase/phosphomutase
MFTLRALLLALVPFAAVDAAVGAWANDPRSSDTRSAGEGTLAPPVDSPSVQASAVAASAGAPRVVVVGFDGADWRTTAELMALGQLPNLAALAAQGTAGPLLSTDPAESAAGWAAINTGANPAKNGVATFVDRAIAGGVPTPDMAHIRKRTVPLTELAPGGLLGLYAQHGRTRVAWFAGVGAALLLLLVFRFVLRARGLVAALLATLVGGAAGYGAHRVGADVPAEVPDVWETQVGLDGFWVHAARAGRASVALDAALAGGRPTGGARVLHGLGLPDLRGAYNGEWFVYTTDELASSRPPVGDTRSSASGTGTVFRVDWKDDELRTEVYGPVDFVARARMQSRADWLQATLDGGDVSGPEARALRDERENLVKELADLDIAKKYKYRVTQPLLVKRLADASYEVTLGNTTHKVASGGWSEMYRLRFDLSPLVKAHAVTRVRVLRDEPFELYVDSLHLDPDAQAFWQPVTEPRSFGSELVKANGGPFETLGWGCFTNQQKDELVPVEVFLEDVEFTHEYRRRLTKAMLAKDDWRLLFSVFSFTDRVQHILYRCYDPEHPMFDEVEAAQEIELFGERIALRDAIPAAYRQMDRVVGEVMAALRPGDVLMLCADHGFTSYRRGLVVNNWLAQEGFLALRDDLGSAPLNSLKDAVDWSRTQAYSLGLGLVYLNLAGREPQGIVAPDEADGILARIQERFLALRDGEVVVGTSARIMKGFYEGPHPWGSRDYPCADLMLGFAENYRVAWPAVTGGMRLVQGDDGRFQVGELLQDNTQTWSGDHASNDPALVTGIFFSNRKVRVADGAPVSVLDVAPTVLSLLQVPLPEELDRPALLVE